MIGVANQSEVVFVVVHGKRDPGGALENRVEQRVAVGVAGAADGLAGAAALWGLAQKTAMAYPDAAAARNASVYAWRP